MKLEDLFEMPIHDRDGIHKPPVLYTESTPSLDGLLRECDYLGRMIPSAGRSYDFWLSKQHHYAKITTPLSDDKSESLDLTDKRAKQIEVTSLDFQKPDAAIPLKNKLQVSSVGTHEKHRGRFLSGALYILLARYGYSVISDHYQFNPGKGLWKSIAERSELLKYHVRIWDRAADDWIHDSKGKILRYNAANLDDSKIWHDVETQFGKLSTLLVLTK